MANKKKRVDIVCIQIDNVLDGCVPPSFPDLFKLLDGAEISQDGKQYEFRSLETKIAQCIIGIVETTQDKDIPPIKNKQTKKFSPVQIDTNTEGLAFANIFLFDTSLNVLIYEVNRNGCYLQSFIELLEQKWMEQHVDNEIHIRIGAVCRLDEYYRLLRIHNYRKISYEICCPSEVLRVVRQQEESLSKSLLESQLAAADSNGVNIISIEQKCMPVNINRDGMQAGFVHEFAGLFNSLLGAGQRCNIKKFIVHGYTLDPESEKQRTTTINLLADVFDEYIIISEVKVQSSLQVLERKTSIEALYCRVHDELTSIIHSTKKI